MIKRMLATAAAVLALVAFGAAAGAGAVAGTAAPGAGAVASAAMAGNGAAAATVAARAPKTFLAATAVEPTRLARYSATTGALVQFLTAPEPGGGVGDPELSPDGRTVLFLRGQGSCADTIDTVPARGGAERVLIPMTGALGMAATIPDIGSFSADGRYLLYSMTRCANLAHHAVYLRKLRTGRTVVLSRRGPALTVHVAFINRDRQVVYSSYGQLAVLNLRPLRLHVHAAPRGCSYGPLATPGTGTLVTATLECGRLLRVVTISAPSFSITATIATLRGRCQQAVSLSAAQRRRGALLLEATGCHNTERIVVIRNGRATVLLSGPSLQLPQAPVW
jgi:hypothetical protein